MPVQIRKDNLFFLVWGMAAERNLKFLCVWKIMLCGPWISDVALNTNVFASFFKRTSNVTPKLCKKIINRANRWKGKERWAQRQIIDYHLFGPPSKSGVAPSPPGMSGKTSHVMTGHRSTIKVHLNYLIRNPVMNLGLCWLIYPILSYPRFRNPWIDSWTRFGS